MPLRNVKLNKKAKAERKKEEKKKAVEAHKAEKVKKGAPTKWSQRKTRQRKVLSSSSENEEAIEYADSSSEMSVDEDEDEALLNRSSECGERFKKDEQNKAIGCDTEYCGRWYHPRCTDIDFEGKNETQIWLIDFVCKHC